MRKLKNASKQNYNKYKKKYPNLLIILGDYNAKIGRERAFKRDKKPHIA